jgi:hypothetical protein
MTGTNANENSIQEITLQKKEKLQHEKLMKINSGGVLPIYV